MKTFPEAFGAVVSIETEAKATPERIAELTKYQEERFARFKGISEEIEDFGALRSLISGMVKAECCEQHAHVCVANLCVVMITLGVQIGMEMERQGLAL